MNRAELIKAIAEEIAEEMLEHIETLEPLTNGEVIKAVFGKSYADIDDYIYGSKDVEVKQWWRSPYKGVSE